MKVARSMVMALALGMAASPAWAQGADGWRKAPAPLVSSGQQGKAVAEVQRMLAACGAHLRVDGAFGAETLVEVVAFQRANGLRVDGIVGPETRGALTRAIADLAAPKAARVAPPPPKPVATAPKPVAVVAKPAPTLQVEPPKVDLTVPGPAGEVREHGYLGADGKWMRQAQRFNGRSWEDVGEPTPSERR